GWVCDNPTYPTSCSFQCPRCGDGFCNGTTAYAGALSPPGPVEPPRKGTAGYAAGTCMHSTDCDAGSTCMLPGGGGAGQCHAAQCPAEKDENGNPVTENCYNCPEDCPTFSGKPAECNPGPHGCTKGPCATWSCPSGETDICNPYCAWQLYLCAGTPNSGE